MNYHRCVKKRVKPKPTGVLLRSTTRHDIQGMRGIAVLLVVLYHAGLPLPGGFVGVDIFFVISGFVISGLLVRELNHSGTIRFRVFYARRIRRLLPALTLVVLTTLLLSFALGSPFDRQQEVTALTGLSAILMVANAAIFLNSGNYFATPPTNNPLLNTWSLSVEEQFYLVFPLILLAIWLFIRRKGSWGRGQSQSRNFGAIVGITVLAIASFLLSLSMSYGVIRWRFSDPDWFAFYSSPTRAWEFAVGSLVFLLFGYETKTQKPRLGAALLILGTLGMLAGAVLISESSVFPGYIALLPVLSTAVAITGGSMSARAARGFLASRPLTALGDVSYSWYLWHWPFIAFTVLIFGEELRVTLTAALVSLVLAVLTFRFIENPIRFQLRFSRTKASTLAATSIVLVSGAAAALFFGAQANWWNSELQSMDDQVSAVHLWQSTGCDTPTPMGNRSAECIWNGDALGAPIYLVGDSMAGMLSEGAVGAGEILGRPVIPGTLGACPFIDAALFLDGREDKECTTFVQESLEWLTIEAVPGDVILASSFGYTTMGDAQLNASAFPEPNSTTSDKTSTYLDALGRTIDQLTNAGHQVNVVMPTPGFPQTLGATWFWYPSQCSTLESLTAIDSCGMRRDLASVEQETKDLDFKIETVVRENRGFSLQLRDFLCERDYCATNVGNDWIYLDGTHITVQASFTLHASLAEKLDENMGTS